MTNRATSSTVDWLQLPDTSGYHIVKFLSEAKDVIRMAGAHPRFKHLAQLGLTKLTSNEPIYIPLKLFANYRQLTTTDNVIFQLFDLEDAKTISSMPKLTRAKFLFSSAPNWEEIMKKFFATYCSPHIYLDKDSEKKVVTRRNIIQINSYTFAFLGKKKSTYAGLIAIGKERCLIPHQIEKYSPVHTFLQIITQYLPRSHNSRMIYKTIKQLSYVSGVMRSTGGDCDSFSLRTTLKDYIPINCGLQLEMRRFLSQADFGLVNPRQPPSVTNLPLKKAIPIAMGGIAGREIIDMLLEIYIDYIALPCGSIGPGDQSTLDQLMRDCFSPIIKEIIMTRGLRTDIRNPLILSTRLKHCVIDGITRCSSVMNVKEVNETNFLYLDRGLFLAQSVYCLFHKEYEIINDALKIYGELKTDNESNYYLSNGKVRSVRTSTGTQLPPYRFNW